MRGYMKNKSMVAITVGIVSIIAFSIISLEPNLLAVYGGVTLDTPNVAKTIQVRVNPTGTSIESTFDSFSRVGFVDGEANFLLESVPSKDKKPFYLLVKKSLESKNPLAKNTRINVSIDIFSGDGDIIETLLYKECAVVEYFVYGVDTKGKIFFLEEDGTVEIREVTKFECISFSLDIPITEEISQIDNTISKIERSPFEFDTYDPYFSVPPANPHDGDLYFNSVTNTLQRYHNGTWVDISGVGGPAVPRK